MRPTGKTNVLSLLVIAGVIGGIYLVAIYSGVYLDNIEVKDAVASAHNTWGTVNQEMIHSRLLTRLNDPKLGKHMRIDEFGAEKEVGGLGIETEQITIEADDVTRHLVIRVEYDRVVKYKPFKKTARKHFVVTVEGPFPR